ncbi:unnamed protein product, partial [Nesidiocoris tenuis]
MENHMTKAPARSKSLTSSKLLLLYQTVPTYRIITPWYHMPQPSWPIVAISITLYTRRYVSYSYLMMNSCSFPGRIGPPMRFLDPPLVLCTYRCISLSISTSSSKSTSRSMSTLSSNTTSRSKSTSRSNSSSISKSTSRSNRPYSQMFTTVRCSEMDVAHFIGQFQRRTWASEGFDFESNCVKNPGRRGPKITGSTLLCKYRKEKCGRKKNVLHSLLDTLPIPNRLHGVEPKEYEQALTTIPEVRTPVSLSSLIAHCFVCISGQSQSQKLRKEFNDGDVAVFVNGLRHTLILVQEEILRKSELKELRELKLSVPRRRFHRFQNIIRTVPTENRLLKKLSSTTTSY